MCKYREKGKTDKGKVELKKLNKNIHTVTTSNDNLQIKYHKLGEFELRNQESQLSIPIGELKFSNYAASAREMKIKLNIKKKKKEKN